MATRPSPLGGDRRGHVALVVVLALLALAGYANATVRHRRASAANAPTRAVGQVFLSGEASSSAWYCPGPLPLDVGKDTAAVELANVSGRAVRGELDLVTDRGLNLVHQVRLAPHSTLRQAFPTPKRPGWGAASVLLDSRGVGVTEIEHGSAGPVATACTTSVGTNATVAGGATTKAANIALALYDPGATPAVANVSFTTSSGSNVAPPAFQGLAIGAGQLIVENVGEYLPEQQAVTSFVASSGGRIVVGEMDSDVLQHARTLAFSSGIATAARDWYLPPVPSGGAATLSLLVVNTSTRAAEVAVHTASTSGFLGAATTVRQVAAGATAQFNLARDPSPGALRWGHVSVTAGDGVVVERSLVIPRATAVPALLSAPPKGAARARSAYQLPPTVPAGESSEEGTPLLARGWLLGGGESDASAGEVVTFANPGDAPLTVHLSALGADQRTRASLARVARIGLAPHSVLALDLSGVVAGAPALTLVARADGSFECGADLYARGKGSVGFNSSAAIPLA
ncbi:MAG TPA: DUF5719 family protein [Acidimicrobiales bacterium]|nr:DUF5719 family protein [Acidimicrobiales bacterium]